MLKWKIIGADKDDGTDRCIWINAESEDDAIDQALSMNLVISEIRRDQDPSTTPRATSPRIQGPIQVQLDSRQARALQVTPWTIAKGIVLGLTLWSVIGVLTALFIWLIFALLIAGAIANAVVLLA